MRPAVSLAACTPVVPAGPCAAVAVLRTAKVTLRAPLGNRILRDVTSGRQVPQAAPTN